MNPLILRRLIGRMGFDPASLFVGGHAGFAYDFKNPSKLFQNSNGTGIVSAENDPIGYVSDLSGNANHATQATAGIRPLFSDGALADGNKSLVTPSITLSGLDKLTIIACVQTNSGSNQGLIQLGNGTSSGTCLLWMSGVFGQKWSSRLIGSASVDVANNRATPSLTPKVISSVYDYAGAAALNEVVTRVDGEAYGCNTEAAGPAGTAHFSNGAFTLLNCFLGTGLVGKAIRLIVIGRALSADELYEAEKWAAAAASIPIIPETPPSGASDYSFISLYGQSLAMGISSSPVISSVRRFDTDYMFSGGTEAWSPSGNYTSLIPLAEGSKIISGGNADESPVSGFAEALHESGFGGKTIGMVGGFPGTAIADLSKGDNAYTGYLSSILNGWRRSREQFQSFKVRAFAFMQGESDGATSGYSALLNQLKVDLNTDIKATTLQTEDVWCLSYQLPMAKIGLQHLAAQEDYGNIRVASPLYQLPTVDGVHLTNVASKVIGAYFGLAYKAIIVDGNTAWKPLMVSTVSVSGQNIDLTYNVPAGALAFDTTTVAAQTNHGFRLVDSGGSPLTISSVSILNADTVRIVAAATVPAGAKVYYGFSDPANTSEGTDKGNLRDTQGDTVVFDGGGINYPMHNWAVLQLVQLP